ncbi:MAG: SET domain-containing protein [Gemmatimonadaceae bacterium]|nr:SET domain-containing protein [Gemmatimonadaceae bacterium]
MLRPSPIEGIGVFAITDIPAGCREMFSKPDLPEHWIAISRAEVEALPAHSRFLVENYCLYDEHQYFVPENGFTKMDLACFLNHSDTPNIMSIDDGNFFEALRDIAPGEELLIDYGEIVDSAH